MSRTTKKIVNTGIIICVCIIAAFLAVAGFTKLYKWEASIPDSFLVIKEEPKKEKFKESEFPREVTFQYSMKDGIPLIGKDKEYVFGKLKVGSNEYSYTFYLVEKKNEEYKLLTGKQNGYPFTDAKLFNLTKPFSFETQTGTVTVEFLTLNQYKQFLDYVDYGENWRDVIEYIREKEKEKNPAQ